MSRSGDDARPSSVAAKEQPITPNANTREHRRECSIALQHDDYTIGWVCALPKEMAAAHAMLDSKHRNLPRDTNDTNTYILGNIGPHNVVIACLPSDEYGTNNAANVATNMTRTFRSIRVRFMVGIGAGVPSDKTDLRLGDVVVGSQVIQYDIGKATPGGQIERTGIPIVPQREVLGTISCLRALHEATPSKVPYILQNMLEKWPKMTKYTYPGSSSDRLFHVTYTHDSLAPDCVDCDAAMEVDRPSRPNNDPKIHYGIIASGNLVMKDGIKRDEIAQKLDALCFEMEAAGLMGHSPCLVIRGICDYADSHKNDLWQEYAAAVAAAYAKELLSEIPVTSIKSVDTRDSITPAGTFMTVDRVLHPNAM